MIVDWRGVVPAHHGKANHLSSGRARIHRNIKVRIVRVSL